MNPLNKLKQDREMLRHKFNQLSNIADWRIVSNIEHQIKEHNEAISVLESWDKIKPYVGGKA